MPNYQPCQCDEAVRNRKRSKPYPEVNGPNEDGEISCSFCWDVIYQPWQDR